MSRMVFELPPPGTLHPNNDHDPLPFYYRPVVGRLYRHRLQMGLDLLPAGGSRVLEIGVGSGILVGTLTRRYARYVGTDLELARGLDRLVAPGCEATFRVADLLADALPEGGFDAIVCFSVLEHIADLARAAGNLARALAPGGVLVAGYPMVNRLMSRAFDVIGFHGIDNHHVSTPVEIERALRRPLRLVAGSAFPPGAPVRAALYRCTSWRRADVVSARDGVETR